MDRLDVGTQTDRVATKRTSLRSREHQLKKPKPTTFSIDQRYIIQCIYGLLGNKKDTLVQPQASATTTQGHHQTSQTERNVSPCQAPPAEHNAAKQQQQQKRTQFHSRAGQTSVSRHITASQHNAYRGPTSSQPIKQDWPLHRDWRHYHCPTARYCGPSRILTPNQMIPIPTPIRP